MWINSSPLPCSHSPSSHQVPAWGFWREACAGARFQTCLWKGWPLQGPAVLRVRLLVCEHSHRGTDQWKPAPRTSQLQSVRPCWWDKITDFEIKFKLEKNIYYWKCHVQFHISILLLHLWFISCSYLNLQPTRQRFQWTFLLTICRVVHD